MILKSLIPPKWRKTAPKPAPASSAEQLAQQATGGADPGTRRQACKQIVDLALLGSIAADDGDAGVRAFAAARLRSLLTAAQQDGPDLQTRIDFLGRCKDPLIAAHLLGHAAERELREAALPLVADPKILADCAINDSAAALRLNAVRQLSDRPQLERVLRLIGKRDKNVYRHARQTLKEIHEREQEPLRIRAEAEALCERAETLGRRETWSQDKALLDHLEHQWAELGDGLPGELQERFQQARQTFDNGYAAYREANQARLQEEEAREQLLQSKQQLLRTLEALQQDDYLRETADRLEQLTEQWKDLAALPQEQEHPLQKAFAADADTLRARLDKQRALNQRNQQLSDMCAEAEAWLARTAPIDARSLRRWAANGKKAAGLKPDDAAARRFGDLETQLRERLQRQQTQAEEKLAKIAERVALLENELGEGVLRKAGGLHQSIHADLELIRLSGVKHPRFDELDRHFHQLTPRLRELQNWRKWGADQHRETLCEKMARLETAEMPLEELTEQIQALQAEWKKLDSSGSPVNEKLWKRFHNSADTAFQRCRPFLEQQAAEKAANRQAREDLCQQLEDFLEQVDWQRMDWKKAAHAERDIRNAWSRIGPVELKHRRALDKRYRNAMKRLDVHLSKERQQNRDFKKQLIDQAIALSESPDIDQAIEDIKQLQRQWHTTVPSKRKQENQLWQQFRAACDDVFNRRREVQQAQRQVADDQLRALRELCGALERLAETVTDPRQLPHQLQALQTQWREADSRNLPRGELNKLDTRYQAAVRAVQDAIARLRDDAERMELDKLRALAALCRELEAAVERADDSSTDHWTARWNALEQPDRGADVQAIRKRFEDALSAQADAAAAAAWSADFVQNQATREALCLRLEVLAGIDSPPEAAEERLAFQVSRLSERLSQGEADPLDQAPNVERTWYLCGAVAAAHASRLEDRFERARRAVLTTPAAAQAELAESGAA